MSVKADIIQLHTKHNNDSRRFEDKLNGIHEQVILTTNLVQSSQTGVAGLTPELDSTLPSEDIPEIAHHHDEDDGQIALGLMTRQDQVKINEETEAGNSDSPGVKPNHTHDLEEIKSTQSSVPEVRFSGFPLESILNEQSSARTYAFSVSSQSSSCSRVCPCSCHRQKPAAFRFSIPPLLGKICGDLFGGYTGYPVASPRCSHQSCLRLTQMRLHLIYLFPSWFVRKSLEILIQRSFGGITVNLKIYREMEWRTGSIFQCAANGNLPLLEQRLREDPTCVNARMPGPGTTPLQIALISGYSESHMDLVEALLQNGADPYMVGGYNLPTMARATELVLSNQRPQYISRRITELLPITAYIEELGLCFLTKVVLRLCPVDLKSVLQSADDTILQQLESRDEIGRTPLHWAAASNDSCSARELLKAGAAVDVLSASDHLSALFLAIVPSQLNKDTSLIDALLEAGADVNLVCHKSGSPFSQACYFADVPTVRKLRQAGGDIDANCSPLAAAADANRFDVMEYLLEEGADIEQVNMINDISSTPLLCAVEENAHECIELLFRYKADYTRVNRRQETILHLAAEGANLETINVLRKQDLRDLDLAARNASGKTALEIHETYSQDPVISRAFKNLLHTIENQKCTNQELCNEDIFYDAVEEWSASSLS